MGTITLQEFISVNRQELIGRCRAKVSVRSGLPTQDEESDQGVPLFLDQLVRELKLETSSTREINTGAILHGRALFFRGLTVSQVVHAYGDVCQSITDLAVELNAPIDPTDFRTLNRCLDDAIAGAVSEYARQQGMVTDSRAIGQSLEMSNLIFTAITAFEALQSGSVGVAGTTGTLVHRSLVAMKALVSSPMP